MGKNGIDIMLKDKEDKSWNNLEKTISYKEDLPNFDHDKNCNGLTREVERTVYSEYSPNKDSRRSEEKYSSISNIRKVITPPKESVQPSAKK